MGVPVIEDLGSGTPSQALAAGLSQETDAPSRLRLGADLVLFSGDKLMGGPQAGIALGRERLVAAMRTNPLDRALRLDKLTLAALDWTLSALLEGREQEIPALHMLGLSPVELEARARGLAAALGGADPVRARVEVVREQAPIGGGSLPGVSLETWVVRVRDASGRLGADAVAAALRAAPVPVLARVRDDAVVLDARTLLPGDDAAVVATLQSVLDDCVR